MKKISHMLLLPLIIVFLSMHYSFALTGPVSDIPGGYTLIDSDPVVGEQWGREGGEDINIFKHRY